MRRLTTAVIAADAARLAEGPQTTPPDPELMSRPLQL